MKPSLYVHIPFCRSKCAYCDFFSVPAAGGRVPDEYVGAVLREARFRAAEENADAWRTVYIGGGTPSLLSPAQIVRLVSGLLSASAERPEEVTMEVNPCDVTAEKLSAMEEAGVTRLSCGIQALDGKALRAVRRRSSEADTVRALESIRARWRGIFSADMIAGLPGQSGADFLRGLERLAAFSPDHISLYSLTIEEDTPLGAAVSSGALDYDDDAADRMWLSGRDFLLRKGYGQYEVSNFCRRGTECRHNLACWRQEDYVGVGAGAVGTIYGRITRRRTNTRDIGLYTEYWRRDCGSVPRADSGCGMSPFCAERTEAVCARRVFDGKGGTGRPAPDSGGGAGDSGAAEPSETEMIDGRTRAFEFLMLGLRTAEGVCAETYSERFHADFSEKTKAAFAAWGRRGLCRVSERNGRHFYAMTGRGLVFLNRFLEEIL